MTGVTKSTSIAALGTIVNIEPLHLTFKTEVVKPWSSIRETTKGKYSEKRIAVPKAIIHTFREIQKNDRSGSKNILLY